MFLQTGFYGISDASALSSRREYFTLAKRMIYPREENSLSSRR